MGGQNKVDKEKNLSFEKQNKTNLLFRKAIIFTENTKISRDS